MYVVCVSILVKSESVKQFIEATFDNAGNTRKEPGNVRFDVLRGEEDPNRFMLYEAYHTKDDFVKHQQTAHYAKWKAAVADWMAQPRQGVKYAPVFWGDARA